MAREMSPHERLRDAWDNANILWQMRLRPSKRITEKETKSLW